MGTNRTLRGQAAFWPGLKNSWKGYFLWSFQLPFSIQQAPNKRHQHNFTLKWTKRKQLSNRGTLTSVAAGMCLNQTGTQVFFLVPLYKVVANLQHIKHVGHSLAEGRQVWKKFNPFKCREGDQRTSGQKQKWQNGNTILPKNLQKKSMTWARCPLAGQKTKLISNKPCWRKPQDCWLLERFYQREKSSCKWRIVRLSRLISVPGQSWSQDTLQGVWPHTAGLTLLLQRHCWQADEKSRGFIKAVQQGYVLNRWISLVRFTSQAGKLRFHKIWCCSATNSFTFL